MLPELLLRCMCWVLGEYGCLAQQLPPPARATPAQVADRLCAAVGSAQAGPGTRACLITAITKLAAAAGGGSGTALRPDGEELLRAAAVSSCAELRQRAHEARALLR